MRVRFFFALASICAVAAACEADSVGPNCEEISSTVTGNRGDTVLTASGLRYLNQATGSGAAITSCDRVGIHYKLVVDTTVIDSLRDPGFVYNVVPGQTPPRTILGVSEGLLGLQVGSKRRLIIPPSLGYGADPVTDRNTGAVIIPGNSTLIFDLEVRQIR